MRKTIIFGAIAALFGLVATAEAGNDAERTRTNGGPATYADTDDRGNMAAHANREHVGHRMHHRDDDDAHRHGKEAREHQHRTHVDRD